MHLDEAKQILKEHGFVLENASVSNLDDIDNAPDTIIDYTGDFVDRIKKGQYK